VGPEELNRCLWSSRSPLPERTALELLNLAFVEFEPSETKKLTHLPLQSSIESEKGTLLA